jgi:A/G-specific adenine glycosylase
MGKSTLTRHSFSTRLLQWWDIHGRKDLPWQHPRTLYQVWVSEIMLQQTQVKTVIPYFDRFMERFPDVETLATADPDDVLALWSGLGYYARARNLLKAAKICCEQHEGQLPQTAHELAALPGIGESTANAIYSQALDKPAVILDGNVKRVLARYFAIEGWPGTSRIHRQLWARAEKLLPKERGADYTQAIMDLGATLCMRSKPGCGQCPVAENCKAHKTGTVIDYPGKRPRSEKIKKSFQMLVLTDHKGRVLLERRPPAGIWGGLWCLPSDDDGRSLQERLNLDGASLTSLPCLRHQLSHLDMTITPLISDLEFAPTGVECAPEQRWFGNREWPGLGLPKPARQLLETYLESDKK